jgi:Bacterial antitoxin of type II TA system, VapB
MVEQPEAAMTDVVTKPDSEEIDEGLLAEAQWQIAGASPNAVINEGLRRLVEEERAKRRAARKRLQRLHDEGFLDYSQLDAAEE